MDTWPLGGGCSTLLHMVAVATAEGAEEEEEDAGASGPVGASMDDAVDDAAAEAAEDSWASSTPLWEDEEDEEALVDAACRDAPREGDAKLRCVASPPLW